MAKIEKISAEQLVDLGNWIKDVKATLFEKNVEAMNCLPKQHRAVNALRKIEHYIDIYKNEMDNICCEKELNCATQIFYSEDVRTRVNESGEVEVY